MFAPTESVPEVKAKVPVTSIELSKVTPPARLIDKLFIAETVELEPGNVDGPTITIVPLFSIVPPPVKLPLMVKVTPESTRNVPDVTVTLFKVWFLEIRKVPPLIVTLFPAGMVLSALLFKRKVPPETVVRPV